MSVVVSVSQNKPLSSLCRRLGYTFVNEQLLKTALTHRSAVANNNERLEFLGDSILNFTAAEYLFTQFPDAKEGELSRLRAMLVKGDTLAEIARELELGDYLLLGEGELKSGGFRRSSILADCVEALIGAIYLDGGMSQAKSCVISWYQQRLDNISLDDCAKDPKSKLQEWLQARKMPLPVYSVVETEGQAHCQSFTVKCEINSLSAPILAHGKSRRKAEKEAAQTALSLLRESAKS